jgi:FixJ family two-component response regulator
MNERIVHVVDDDEPMRTAVARLLSAEGYEVRTYASAGDFLLAPPDSSSGCVVLDLQMPGPSGLDLQQALQRYSLPLPIVFLTGRGDVTSSVRAMKAGAVDFLTKPVEPAHLLRAVEAALIRDQSARTQNRGVSEATTRYAKLTDRERSVFGHVIAGKLNKQIANALGISERTVKMHRAQVMSKMQAKSLPDLVHMAELLMHAGIFTRPSSPQG